MAPAQPVTRRELRRAEQPAGHGLQVRRAPVAPGPVGGAGVAPPRTRRMIREAERRGSSRWRRWAPPPAQVPALGLLMAVAFLLGGVTSVQSANATRADRAEAAAAVAEVAHQDRVWAASEARLTGAVTAEAAHHRTQALDAAADALAAADAMLADASGGTGAGAAAPQDAVDSLAAAAARLAALVERTPDPATLLSSTTADDAGLATVADSQLTALGAPAGGAAPTPAPVDTTAPTTAGASSGPLAATGTTVARTTVTDDATTTAVVPSTAGSQTTMEALDGETSDRLLEVAAEVTELVAQVRRAAEEAAAAQLQAAQDAEAARISAEQAVANELARKIAAADAAPNGDIPSEVLCGVSFDGDVLLRCDAAADLEQLNVAFRAHFGYSMSITDSYRDYDGQVLAKANSGDLAATPGTSNHGRGLAIDLNGLGDVGQFDRPAYLWLVVHAGDFGWLHPSYMNPGGSGPLEPWHWEYKTQ